MRLLCLALLLAGDVRQVRPAAASRRAAGHGTQDEGVGLCAASCVSQRWSFGLCIGLCCHTTSGALFVHATHEATHATQAGGASNATYIQL